MHVLIWLVTGLLAGWLVRRLARAPRWGLLGDAALGSFGAVVGGGLFRLLGITTPRQLAAHVLVATVGAAISLGVMRLIDRLLSRAAPSEPGAAGAGPAGGTLEAQIARLGALERRILARVLHHERTARDPNVSFDQQMTLGQRVADRVASFGGSWPFIGLFGTVLIAWLVFNSEVGRPFDPYPFILLNLVLSCLAAIQAPVIMMSQNRMSAKDRIDASHDFEVNLRAEVEIMQLHAKLDELLTGEWKQLLATQERQIESLQRLEQRLTRTLGDEAS